MANPQRGHPLPSRPHYWAIYPQRCESSHLAAEQAKLHNNQPDTHTPETGPPDCRPRPMTSCTPHTAVHHAAAASRSTAAVCQGVGPVRLCKPYARVQLGDPHHQAVHQASLQHHKALAAASLQQLVRRQPRNGATFAGPVAPIPAHTGGMQAVQFCAAPYGPRLHHPTPFAPVAGAAWPHKLGAGGPPGQLTHCPVPCATAWGDARQQPQSCCPICTGTTGATYAPLTSQV